MRVHYYAHVKYDSPGIYSYEYISDVDNIDQFIKEIYSTLKDHYEEVCGTEELNFIDLGGWEDFLEENEIEYNPDGFFPYKDIWEFMKRDIEKLFDMETTDDIKYEKLLNSIQTYLEIIEDAKFSCGEYLFEINTFKNSRDFAKYFFDYIKNSYFIKDIPRYLVDRIISLANFIDKGNFPNNDVHEGILNEWLIIFNSICDQYSG